MQSVRELEKELLFETKQTNEFRMRLTGARTEKQSKAWHALIIASEESKYELKQKIETMKNQGLKKPTVKGLKTVCSRVLKATGLKVDGTLKKGYKYITGGKVVKVVAKPTPKKKPVAKKKVAAKKKPVKKAKSKK